MLKPLLTLRAVFNLLFGVALLIWMEHEALQGLTRGGYYALVDGGLTLAFAAALLSTRSRGLMLLATADGLLRVALGAFILANPGLEQMVMTTTLLLVCASVACIVIGVVGLFYALVRERRRVLAPGETSLVWLAAAIGFCTLLLGVGLALSFLDQQLRLMLAFYAIALGVILGYTALRLGRGAAHAAPSAGITG